MENHLIVYLSLLENDNYMIPCCDINEGRDFVDPLELIESPNYDVKGLNPDGLYAIGGEIIKKRLLESYKWGIFPWFGFKELDQPYWFCPRHRYVIFPEKIHIGHSMRNLMNKKEYRITINQEFKRVIHHCRIINNREEMTGAWLGEDIERVFLELNESGFAKSVEVWKGDSLVGGFYGFWFKGVFQGDSMFSLTKSASQFGLVELCRNPFIDGEKIKFIDVQIKNPTFEHLGAEYISYTTYRRLMDLTGSGQEKGEGNERNHGSKNNQAFSA